jgi:hypothetical protein
MACSVASNLDQKLVHLLTAFRACFSCSTSPASYLEVLLDCGSCGLNLEDRVSSLVVVSRLILATAILIGIGQPRLRPGKGPNCTNAPTFLRWPAHVRGYGVHLPDKRLPASSPFVRLFFAWLPIIPLHSSHAIAQSAQPSTRLT